jgi:hypothetical protein
MMRRQTRQTNTPTVRQSRPDNSTHSSTASINAMTSHQRGHRETPHTTEVEETEIEIEFKGNNTYAEPKRKRKIGETKVSAHVDSSSTTQTRLQIPSAEQSFSSSSAPKPTSESTDSVTELLAREEDQRSKSKHTSTGRNGTFVGERNRVRITTPLESAVQTTPKSRSSRGHR